MTYLETLNENDIQRIHAASLEIMETVGLDFHHEGALEILGRAGAKIDGQRVCFPPKLVEERVAMAPGTFTLFARNPERNLLFGGDSAVFVPTNCPAFVEDEENGRRYGTMADYDNLVKLTHESLNLDMCSNVPVEPGDVDLHLRPAYMTYSCLRHTDKCFMGSALGEEAARQVIEMMEMVFGDMHGPEAKPRVISIPCSLTPLAFDQRMLEAMMFYAEAGQPQMINSLAIAGSTAPITLAGTLVVQNAEILAGIVLCQLVREGTPVIYASGSSAMDMRTGALLVGAPELAMNNISTAQMARFYGIPSRGCGTLTDSLCITEQAGYESMMNLLTAHTAGIHCILHAAGSVDTINCVSLEKFVLDDDLIGMVKHLRRGVTVDEKTLALEVIRAVGPRGYFLTQAHTFQNCRHSLFKRQIRPQRPDVQFRETEAASHIQKATQRWQAVLEGYRQPGFPESIDRDLREWMERL